MPSRGSRNDQVNMPAPRTRPQAARPAIPIPIVLPIAYLQIVLKLIGDVGGRGRQPARYPPRASQRGRRPRVWAHGPGASKSSLRIDAKPKGNKAKRVKTTRIRSPLADDTCSARRLACHRRTVTANQRGRETANVGSLRGRGVSALASPGPMHTIPHALTSQSLCPHDHMRVTRHRDRAHMASAMALSSLSSRSAFVVSRRSFSFMSSRAAVSSASRLRIAFFCWLSSCACS